MRNLQCIESGVRRACEFVTGAPRQKYRLVGLCGYGGDLDGDVVCQFALQRSVDHGDRIDVRIIKNRLQRAADQTQIIENRRRHIHRILDRAERRHDGTQFLRGLRGELRHLHATRHALVSHEDAGTTRHGDDGNTVALGQFAAAKGATVIDDILNVLDLDDAGLTKCRLIQRHRATKIGGV